MINREKAGEPAPADNFAAQSKPNINALWAVIAGVAFLLLMAGIVAVPLLIKEQGRPRPTVPSAAQPIKRTLSYWLLVKKDPRRFPHARPFRLLPGEIMIFEKGYLARLHLSSPENGYLYIINEGTVTVNGLPQYNLIFPKPSFNNGSAYIDVEQEVAIPKSGWLIFDAEEGVEKLWLIWSVAPVEALEDLKYIVNPRDRGVIGKAAEIRSVQSFLSKYNAKNTTVEKDEDHKRTTIKASDNILISLVRIEHR